MSLAAVRLLKAQGLLAVLVWSTYLGVVTIRTLPNQFHHAWSGGIVRQSQIH
jgi:uncharacterized membrane protein (DUF2068 family)